MDKLSHQAPVEVEIRGKVGDYQNGRSYGLKAGIGRTLHFAGCDRSHQVNFWFYDGMIDELSFYSTALSPAEIQAIYNAGVAGKCEMLASAIGSDRTGLVPVTRSPWHLQS